MSYIFGSASGIGTPSDIDWTPGGSGGGGGGGGQYYYYLGF